MSELRQINVLFICFSIKICPFAQPSHSHQEKFDFASSSEFIVYSIQFLTCFFYHHLFRFASILKFFFSSHFYVICIQKYMLGEHDITASERKNQKIDWIYSFFFISIRILILSLHTKTHFFLKFSNQIQFIWISTQISFQEFAHSFVDSRLSASRFEIKLIQKERSVNIQMIWT